MTNTQQRLYTADDLLRLRNDKGYELIRGELVEMSPTGDVHGVMTAEILILLGVHVRSHKLGRVFGAESGFKVAINPDTVLAPDVAFLSAARAKPLTGKFIDTAPDLAVEVVSPSNSADEMNEKTALFFQGGARQVWIIYPTTRTIHVYTSATAVTILTTSDTLHGGDLLPGFVLPLADLFAVLDS